MLTPRQELELRKYGKEQGLSQEKINEFISAKKSERPLSIFAPPKDQPKKEGDGFLKSLVKDPIKTLIVKPGTRIAQAGVAAVAAATGNNELLERAYQDVDLKTPFGRYKIEGQKSGAAGAAQIAGDAAKAASYLYTPGAAAGVKSTAGRGFKQAVTQGAKSGAIAGGLFGGGDAAGDDPSAASILKGAATGAVTGAAAGAILSGTAEGASQIKKGISNKISSYKNATADSPLVKKAKQQLEQKYNEVFSSTKLGKKTLDKSTAQGKNPAKFLSEHGYILDVEKGKINAVPTIEKISKNVEPLEDVLGDILSVKDKSLPDSSRISLNDLGRRAKTKLNTDTNRASGYLQKQYQEIDRVVGELKQSFGDTVNLSDLNNIKRGQWAQSKVFDATRPSYSSDIHYSIGTTAKDLIEQSIPEADIKSLNAYIGDHLDVIKNLQKVNGNAVKGGRLGNYFARTVGSIVGAQGGPLGSIAGAFGGDYVSNIMQSYYIANPIKKMLLQKIEATNPAYKAAQKALQQLRNSEASRLLPAPKFGAPKQSINIPINLPRRIQKLER
jgi:hypothetical protein